MTAPFDWLVQYGYVGLFTLLVLGIIGLPIPDETLLTLAGSLASQGILHLPSTLIVASLGSVCGITLSYGLGRTFGLYLIHRYGALLHLTPERFAQMEKWVAQWGKWGLVVGYFIPGVRHFVAYIAGMSELPIRIFALFAYTGGFLWSAAFITLGYFLGEGWHTFVPRPAQYLSLGALGMLIVCLGLTFVGWQRWRVKTSAKSPPG